MRTIVIRFKGDSYCVDTGCATLREFFESTEYRRRDVAEWWYKEVTKKINEITNE